MGHKIGRPLVEEVGKPRIMPKTLPLPKPQEVPQEAPEKVPVHARPDAREKETAQLRQSVGWALANVGSIPTASTNLVHCGCA